MKKDYFNHTHTQWNLNGSPWWFDYYYGLESLISKNCIENENTMKKKTKFAHRNNGNISMACIF